MKHKVVFMGTPDFAVPALIKLIETQDVVGVVTQPDKPAGRGKKVRKSPVKITAEQANIPVFQPQSLRKENAADPIRAWKPDVIIVAAFGQILRPHLLDYPTHGCINVHASLLPRWRGASPIQHAILTGDHTTGISLMKMDVGLDTGDVYVKEEITIEDAETAQSLHDKLAELGSVLISRDLPRILTGELTADPQNEAQAIYAGMIQKSDGQITWNKSATDIDRLVRAMTPWPSAYTYWQNKPLKIKKATSTHSYEDAGKVGDVVSVDQKIVVITGDGGLVLHQLQLAGKRMMNINDFVNGHPNFVGSTLGNLPL